MHSAHIACDDGQPCRRSAVQVATRAGLHCEVLLLMQLALRLCASRSHQQCVGEEEGHQDAHVGPLVLSRKAGVLRQ